MTDQIMAVIPDDVDVSKSTQQGCVILKIEVRLEGEEAGDRRAFQNYQLDPFEALEVGRRLQDQALQVLLALAGYERPPHTVS